MKLINFSQSFLRTIIWIAVGSTLTMLLSCGGDSDDPKQELNTGQKVVTNLVKSQWKVSSVMVDGMDMSSMFTGFTISFNPSSYQNGIPSFTGSYSVTNGGPVWYSSGNWIIPDINMAGSFIRSSDDLSITLQEVTETNLKMSLQWNKQTFGDGRIGSIQGQHIFTMGK